MGDFPIGERSPAAGIVTAWQPLVSGQSFPNTAISSRRGLWSQQLVKGDANAALPPKAPRLAGLDMPEQPPIRHSPTPDELTALGRDTPDAGIAARPDRLGCVEQLPCDTPNPLKPLKRIVAWKLESGDIPNRDFGCEPYVSNFKINPRRPPQGGLIRNKHFGALDGRSGTA